jgi:mRNA interferase YafO
VRKVRVFFNTDLKNKLTATEVEDLRLDFKNYKEMGLLPDSFGRDVLYDHPNNLPIVKAEEISHIHLTDTDNLWHVRALQFNRTSDVHLVYCEGFTNKDCYLLMAILSPDAHAQANNRTIMHNLGKMAKAFHNKY